MNIFLKLLALLYFSTCIPVAHSKPLVTPQNILILANANDFPQFQNYLQINPQLTPWAQHQQKLLFNGAIEKIFFKALTRAQKAQLRGDLTKARKYYKKLVSLRSQYHWPKSYRDAIHSAFIFLYENQPQTTQNTSWLLKSIAFDPSYPKPLTSKNATLTLYKKLQATAKTMFWEPKLQLPTVEWVLTNGIKYRVTDETRIKLPLTKVFITALTSHARPVSVITEGQNLHSWQPTMQPLISGNCQQFHLWKNLTTAMVYFDPLCIKSSENRNPPVANVESSAREIAKLYPKQQTWERPVTKSLTPQKPLPTKKKFYKNKWFWIGSGIVAASVTLASQNRAPKAHAPKHTEGF